jgi:hypothetical protein
MSGISQFQARLALRCCPSVLSQHTPVCASGSGVSGVLRPGGQYDPIQASCQNGIVAPNGDLICPKGVAGYQATAGPGEVYEPNKASCQFGFFFVSNGQKLCRANVSGSAVASTPFLLGA